MHYASDIILGQKYQHVRTGLEGHATAIYFFENACERVNIQYTHDGDVKNETFDAVELKNLTTLEQARAEKAGGTRGPDAPPRAR